MKKSQRLNSIIHFRTISIILIVGVHCLDHFNTPKDSIFHRLIQTLLSGSTINFVFISGFLYHFVFFSKNRLSSFYSDRVKRLLFPYLFLSIIPIVDEILKNSNKWNHIFQGGLEGFNNEFFQVILFLISGYHTDAYWYVPFALVLFLPKAWYNFFIVQKINYQLVILLVSVTISSLLHRQEPGSLLIWHAYLYFLPAYLLGIFCSVNRTLVLSFFREKKIYFFLLFLLIVVFQMLSGFDGTYSKSPFIYKGFDLMIIQKLTFSILLITWLSNYEEKKYRISEVVAETSFAIYFIHVYFIKGLSVIKKYFNLDFSDYGFIAFFLGWFIFVLMSVLVTKGINYLMPKYSKYIIGY